MRPTSMQITRGFAAHRDVAYQPPFSASAERRSVGWSILLWSART
jgi:hypothetical protein